VWDSQGVGFGEIVAVNAVQQRKAELEDWGDLGDLGRRALVVILRVEKEYLCLQRQRPASSFPQFEVWWLDLF
jgi:hypothetical protein